MKLIVNIKKKHFILLFFSVFIFFRISALNNKILTKNNNSKDSGISNFHSREFTNSNDEENNKKFIFMGKPKEGNLNKNTKIDQTENEKSSLQISDSDPKLLEDPLIMKAIYSRKNDDKIFDEKKIVELIEKVIRNNEKNNIKSEKSKVIKELKNLNIPMGLNNLLYQNLIRNSDKDIYAELVSHSNFSKSEFILLFLSKFR
jgi:hypothetical protein